MRYLLICLAIVIVVVVYLILGVQYTDRQLKLEYEKFNNANIDGLIEYVGIKYHRIALKIENSSEFVFFANNNPKQGKGEVFEDIAAKGDRIIKPAFSDTLILLKSKVEYRYTFKKL